MTALERRWPPSRGLRRRAPTGVALDAPTQRIHEIDHLCGRALARRFDLFAAPLLLQQLLQRILVLILELLRLEMRFLAFDDV